MRDAQVIRSSDMADDIGPVQIVKVRVEVCSRNERKFQRIKLANGKHKYEKCSDALENILLDPLYSHMKVCYFLRN